MAPSNNLTDEFYKSLFSITVKFYSYQLKRKVFQGVVQIIEATTIWITLKMHKVQNISHFSTWKTKF